MNFWGYTVSEARVINYDKNDKSIIAAISAEVPDINLCIGCGGCTSTCSVGNFTEFNIRKLQMLVKRGEYSDARQQLQKCMACGKCQLVCPRGVDTRRMVLVMNKHLSNTL